MKRMALRSAILSIACLLALTGCRHATVCFDCNYPGAPALEDVSVRTGKPLPLDQKPVPQREGYRFAGWFTDSSCSEQSRWLCGVKASNLWTGEGESMAVESDMTLYAKWTAPVHITSAQEFDAIRNDLYGWYILDADIDLSIYSEWEPIGNYDSSYEYADAEWWEKGFHGVIDGNGHKITGFTLNRRNGFVNTLFGALCNGEIKNLTVESPIINLAGESIYASAMLGYMKDDASGKPVVSNCHVTDALINVAISNDHSVFSGATALVMAGWGGTVKDCTASGKIDLEITSLPEGGELYIGALNGECYCTMERCTSDVDIRLYPGEGAVLNDVKAFVGALQSSATYTYDCVAGGSINVTDHTGFSNLCIGGIAGSERYGQIKDCRALADITVENLSGAHVGSIIGEFSGQYGMIGAISGVETTFIESCQASTDYPFSGNGIPEPATSPIGIGKMGYAINSCTKIQE